MKVLVITGDRAFRPGHPRFDIQAEAVEHLESVYWGPGSLFPQVPGGSFDAVSVQDPFLRGLYGLSVARRMRARFNVQVHADLSAQTWWRRIIAGHVLRRADSVRVVSEKIETQIRQMNIKAPVSVVPIFVDAARFRAVKAEPQDPPWILWIGRFEEEKDPHKAVDVFRAVIARGVDARLIMVGSGGLQEEVRKRSVGLPVQFAGWQQDVTPYLVKASVLMSTSRAESWGGAMVEALAAGVPVVAPDVGIAREAGAIVVPYDGLPEALIRTLSEKRRGELRIPLLSREEWQKVWRASIA